ncbi:MAG: hypothetical protein N2037_02105 [Acidimicrobiales bacterium]|nr:hypothetical protein [Acidimicrobiales bacterium]
MLNVVTHDVIRLLLPAEPVYGRLARIAAQNLALRLGFDFRSIEDLRLAIDELVIFLLRPEGAPGVITIEFTVLDDGLAIDAGTTAGEGQHWDDRASLRRFSAIVSETVDVVTVDEDLRHVHLEKHFPPRAA